tara:strand:- start:647 stop:937 length:291 start_codon:yes stop_codon:yes gene_type:complete
VTNRVEVTDPSRLLVVRSYEERRLSVHNSQPNKVTRNLQGLVVQHVAPTKTGQSVSKPQLFVWPGTSVSVGIGGVLDVRKLINHTGNTEFGLNDKG